MTECPYHPGQPMRPSNYGGLYCPNPAAFNGPRDKKGRCSYKAPESVQAPPTPQPVPGVARPAIVPARAAGGAPEASGALARATAAGYALRTAGQMLGLESDPAAVIALADYLLEHFMVPATKGVPVPAPPPFTQEAGRGF